MNTAIVHGLHRLPRDLDLVVGIPRSGLVAANLLSLAANIPMTDLDSFVAGRVFSSGSTKRTVSLSRQVSDMRNVLVLDDTINTGAAMREASTRIAATRTTANLTFAAVYGSQERHEEVDHVLEVVPQPRMFEWNFMHHGLLGQSCVDIDGVLCFDPTDAENDDGPLYEEFLRNARPLYRPSRKIACLVTSRLERYRSLTQAWLARQGIRYDRLVMLDLPSKEVRRRQAVHARFKGEFYRDCDAVLFIESRNDQAMTIAAIAGKPVLSTEAHRMVRPGGSASAWAGAVEPPPAATAPEAPAATAPDGYGGARAAGLDVSYVLLDWGEQSKSRTLISYLGPTAANAGEVIESVRQVCVSRGELPVVAVSEFDQELMASCAAPIEFVPEMRHVSSLSAEEYQRYVRRRWALILEKWTIEREVTLAASFDEFLAAQPPAA